MDSRCWKRVVSAGSTCDLRDFQQGSAEISGCCLLTGAASSLYCASEASQGKSYALTRLTEAYPCASLRMPVAEGLVLTCTAGQVLVLGASTAAGVSGQGPPPAKRARLTNSGDANAHDTATGNSTALSTEAGNDLEDRRAALRRASNLRSEHLKAAAEREAAERKAAADLALEKRAAAEAAGRAAAAEKEAKAKKKAEKQRQKQEKVQTAIAEEGGRRALPSGLKYDVLRAGSGKAASDGSTVNVWYEGRLAKTGRQFDKGALRFRLGRGEVIRGWDEGIRGMKLGEQRRILVPAHLGYGKAGAPPKIPPGANLIFTVSLNQC
eukprot:TRINITY_DN16885_c0_g1_i1.p1 TRINITY_DN16885_c0_g1~~TRINITY_DN16885_c0_g1_i1.p1  ORF type:complete len:324 (+),score=83.83 TRINITY_DN16885_c0_g1_i1:45-1016(+)